MRTSLGTLAPARRRLVLGLLTLCGVLLVGALGLVLARSLQPAASVDQAVPGPVVVLPGYGGGTESVAPLVEQLRRDGREVVVFAPAGGGTGDLRVQARRVAARTERLLAASPFPSVDVVGYSAGGVVARLWVRDEGGETAVRRVLTLGSPHHGTDVAALAEEAAGGCATACEQLATGSDLLRRLGAGGETPDGPRWVTVRTARDEVVTPVESARLEGALNILVQDVCPGATTPHDGLPGDPVVLAVLRSALGPGAPGVPQDVTC